MSAYADLIERLQMDPLSVEVELEAAAAISRLEREKVALVEALQFYADESGWNQPPVKTIAHELLGPAYENQASKIQWDRGRIAREALSRTQEQSA